MTHNEIKAFSAGSAAAIMNRVNMNIDPVMFYDYREAARQGRFDPSVAASAAFAKGWNGANS